METKFRDWLSSEPSGTRSVSWIVSTTSSDYKWAELSIKGWGETVTFYVEDIQQLRDFRKLIAHMEDFASTVEAVLADQN